MQFTVAIGDVVMSALQSMMFDDASFWSNTMISSTDDNLGSGLLGKEDSGSWLYAGDSDVESLKNGQPTERGSSLMVVEAEAVANGIFIEKYKVPNILYSPENIFANKIAALDANYINPHQYTAVNEAEETQPKSLAATISPTVATWYKAFRNIAIVGLLSVLVYIGIRIVIGTVSEKARYKERLQDWLTALAMIFFMHFIMAGIMMLSEKIIDLVGQAGNTGIIIAVDDGAIFRTTFIGFIRFFTQSNSWKMAVGYSLMYLILVGITCRYTFIYLKRALYLAFFTMIAPMVALTYPIDKVKDGQAQAFNVWIKEYFINAIIQPIHLLLYTTLVGASMSLAVKNPIYGIVVLLFMPTAEKWIKSMFKMDKAPLTATSLGDVAVLGSIFGLGKNMASGVVKGAGTLVGAARTGGIRAVGRGIINSIPGAPIKIAGAAFKAAGGAIGNGISSTPSGNTVEDAIKGTIEVKQGDNKDKDENKNKRPEFNVNLDELRNMVEKDKKKEDSRENAAEVANTIAKTTQKTMNEGMEEYANMGGDTLSDMYESGGTTEKEESGSSLATTITGGTPVENAETKEKSSEYEKSQLQSQKVEKLTKSSESKEISDMINKGVVGALTGSAGAAIGAGLGAIAAGGLGDAKTMLAGGMAGATTATALAGEMMKAGDSVYNNNIKVLVKTEGVTNKNIIQNTAKVAQKEGWSEDKMKMVAQLAEKYPKLADNKGFQTAIATQLREAGVKSDKAIEKAIKDIEKVQISVDKIEAKENEISKKNIKNWK